MMPGRSNNPGSGIGKIGSRPRQTGTVLLEVILALILFVGTAAVISSAMSASVTAVERIRLNTHAVNLAVSLVAELEMGRYPLASAGPTPWETPFQEWTWQIQADSTAAGTTTSFPLKKVVVTIRHESEPVVCQLTQFLPANPIYQSETGTGEDFAVSAANPLIELPESP